MFFAPCTKTNLFTSWHIQAALAPPTMFGRDLCCFFWCFKNNIQSNRGQKVRDYCLDDSTCMTEISIGQIATYFKSKQNVTGMVHFIF